VSLRCHGFRDGASRCFGFVGFKTADEAAAALKYFHTSFLDTSRLEITVAESFKELDKAQKRPWSKHTKGKSGTDAADTTDGDTAKLANKQKRKADAEVRTCFWWWMGLKLRPSHHNGFGRDELFACLLLNAVSQRLECSSHRAVSHAEKSARPGSCKPQACRVP
jgi:hypothetical protein